MKNKSNIIKDYKNKINILKKHNHFYFNEDKPRISDSEYDSLKKEIFLLEQENNDLKNWYLLSILVGAITINKFKKISSCTNAFSI